MEKLYIYLTGRSKKGIKMVAIMRGSCPARRLDNAKQLGIPHVWEQAINDVIYEHRMHYEPWVESAASPQALLDAIKKRGYSELNASLTPIVNLAALMVKDMPNVLHHHPGSVPPEANHLALKKLSR